MKKGSCKKVRISGSTRCICRKANGRVKFAKSTLCGGKKRKTSRKKR